ncbi:MAG: hypothetical protein WCD86_26685 [Ktedonobacteraceae bacterium]
MNMNTPFSGGFADYHESSVERAEQKQAITGVAQEQIVLDYLLDMGFTWEESVRLADVREHLYEGSEMRERLASDYRMEFARWLLAHGEIGA